MRQDKVFAIRWASLYPMYVKKAEAKGRTRRELDQVIRWLTGYTPAGLREQLESDNDLETFCCSAVARNGAFDARSLHRAARRSDSAFALRRRSSRSA